MADDSIQYGPAESRKGHFPIEFTSNEPEAGHFHPPSELTEFLNKIPLIRNLLSAPTGSITVNPANSNNPQLTVQHEATHGILDPLFESGQLSQLNSQNPAYQAIANKIISAGGANANTANTEVPAYSSTGESKQVGVDIPASQTYIDKLRSQLLQLNPKIAKQLGATQ